MEIPCALQEVFIRVRQTLNRQKISTFRCLIIGLEAADANSAGVLTIEEFQNVVGKLGIFFTKSELWQLKKHYKGPGDTRIISNLMWKSVMSGLMGKFSERRENFVHALWSHLVTENESELSKDVLFKTFSASKHPKVISGITSEDKILNEFIESFEAFPDPMTKEFFCEGFSGINVSVHDSINDKTDKNFTQLFTNCFEMHIEKKKQFDMDCIRNLVQEKLRQRQRGNESFQQTLYRLFKFFDTNDNMMVDFSEFELTLRKLGLHLHQNDCQIMFNLCDADKDGSMGYREWIKAFLGDEHES